MAVQLDSPVGEDSVGGNEPDDLHEETDALTQESLEENSHVDMQPELVVHVHHEEEELQVLDESTIESGEEEVQLDSPVGCESENQCKLGLKRIT